MSRFWGLISLLVISLILMAACYSFMLPLTGCTIDHFVEVKELRLTVEKVVIAELHNAATQPSGGSDWSPLEPTIVIEVPDE